MLPLTYRGSDIFRHRNGRRSRSTIILDGWSLQSHRPGLCSERPVPIDWHSSPTLGAASVATIPSVKRVCDRVSWYLPAIEHGWLIDWVRLNVPPTHSVEHGDLRAGHGTQATSLAEALVTVLSRSDVTSVNVTRGGNWGCHPYFFPEKNWWTFFLIAVTFIDFARVSLSPLEGVTSHLFYLSDLVCPLFFVKSPTILYSFGCHPPGGCHPQRSASPLTPPSPSDATALTGVCDGSLEYSNALPVVPISIRGGRSTSKLQVCCSLDLLLDFLGINNFTFYRCTIFHYRRMLFLYEALSQMKTTANQHYYL